MSEVNIDSIRIEAKTNIKEAISDIEALKQSLTGLGDNKSGIDHYSTSVNGLTQRLTKLTGITNKAGIAAVEKSVRELAEASIKLNNLQLNEKKGSIFSEDTWKRAMENVESAMESVKNTIAQNVKEIRQLDGVEKAFDNYIKKAQNIKIPIGVKNDLSTDREFANLRSVLGKNFSTTNSGTDFVTFIDDMNKSINTTFDTTKNATDLFRDVVERLRDIRKEAVMTSQDVIKNGLIPVQEIESELSKFAAKDIPNLSEKYGLTENDVYGGKKLSENNETESVKEVTSAIGQKTRAFEKEQQTVTDVVNSEMKDLINLRSTIESVTSAVGDGKGLAGAFKGLKELGLGELASLKNIDFSGIAKLNRESLKTIIGKKYTGLSDTEKTIIQNAANKAVAPESVPWLEDYEKLIQQAREESQKFLGGFYVPKSVEELQTEFVGISKEIVHLKENMQEALRTLDTDGVSQMVDDLSQAIAYANDLSTIAAQKGITLRQPKSEWQEYPPSSFPEELRGNGLSNTMSQTARETSNASNQLRQYNEDVSKVIRTEETFKDALAAAAQEPPIFRDMPDDINRLNRNMQKLPLSLSQLKSDISDLAGIMGGFVGKAISVAGAIGKIGSFAAKVNKQILSFTKNFAKLSWEFLNFGSSKNALSGLKSPFSQSSASLGDFNKKLKHGITTVLRYGFGIRSLYVLFNKLRSGIKDGINNLVMFSDRANKSLSLLTSDMSYVGNSVAAAFEPILNIVGPIIDQIVDYAVAGINAVGAFIASITGQTSYTVAVKNIKDYRDSLNGTASAGDAASDATDKLKDKTDELKHELMGFDEIEKFSEDLDNAANSGSGSGSGSGNGSGTEDPILFTKKDIPGAVSNFADLVKDAWAKSDFTDIGKIVGAKLRDALDSIDWEPIKEQANKIAKVTGTFINGFFETEGLDKSVGRTLGEAVNTAVGAINTFIDTTHWTSLGEFMSGGLRSAIATIDWDGLGKTINAKYKALWGFLDGFVVDMSKINFSGTTGWQEAGNALASTINSIFADRDYTKTGQTIAVGINGITSALTTGIEGIDFNSISRNFSNGINSIFYKVDWQAIGTMLSDGMNTATSSLLTFSVTVDWKRIGSELASSANTFLANTDFSQAGKALGQAFKGALSTINEFAATFNWRSLGIDINNFIKGINWMGILKTSANVVANTFFGLFETAWAAVFGGPDTKYTAIADNLNKALSKLKIEWPAMEQEEIEKFENVSIIVDKFLELNEKLKKNGSLSETDMSLFKTYYDQIVEYAPQAANLIGKVGEAYEGTDGALKSLIESQKNLAIQEGFKKSMQDAAKIYSDAALSLNGAVTELVNSVAKNQQVLYDAWTHDKPGTWDQFQTDLENLFQKMRDGSLDVDKLTESESRMINALVRADDPFSKQTENIIDLIGTKNEAEETLDRISAASQRYGGNAETAATNTEKLVTSLGKIKFTGVWKSLKDELKNTLDDVTETLKRDDFTLGISNTLTDMFDKEFKVNLKAGSLDTSELTPKDKTIQGASANVVSAKNALPDYAKKLDLVANLTSKQDSITDRVISGLTGWMTDFQNRVPENNRWFSGLTGWMTDFQNRVPENNRWFSGLTGWMTDFQNRVPENNRWFSGLTGWMTDFQNRVPENNRWFSGLTGWMTDFQNRVPENNRWFSGLTGWMTDFQNRVPENNRWFSGLTGWMTDFQNRVPENNRWFSGLTGWMTDFQNRVPENNRWFSGLTGWMTDFQNRVPENNRWFSGLTGYVNQVEKQPGSSLILKGIHGIVSSIANIFTQKAEGGAFYGGRWHDIPQFSSGGVITKDFMSSFSAIPRYAGGTVNAGSMFIAGEAGPELVGHVGGRTEVLNQSQLASVMQSAVASGMEAVMARYGGNGGGNGNVTVNVVLQGDAKKIFEVVKKENNSRVIQTGKAQLLT
jgi:hypothetical protein